MKLLVLSIFFTFTAYSSTTVIDLKSKATISYKDLIALLPVNSHIVLGEFHSDNFIQQAQAKLIKKVVKHNSMESDFNINWEFLNFTDQGNTDLYLNKLKNNLITAKSFLELTAGKKLESYLPIINTVKDLDGNLIGTNLPRSLKQKVIKSGLTSIDQNLIPKTHYLGGENYLNRFIKVMSSHLPPNKITSYFLAQSLTDSVLAHHSFLNEKKLNFLIAGSFHTDFNDGAVEKLRRITALELINIKIVNTDKLNIEELLDYYKGNIKYGEYADYVILVNSL